MLQQKNKFKLERLVLQAELCLENLYSHGEDPGNERTFLFCFDNIMRIMEYNGYKNIQHTMILELGKYHEYRMEQIYIPRSITMRRGVRW